MSVSTRELVGRQVECARLDRLLEAARAGRSGVLVVRGEPGVGKTALLDWAAGRAGGMRVLRARGVEAEAGLAFAGLDELVRPVLAVLGDAAGAPSGGARGGVGVGRGV